MDSLSSTLAVPPWLHVCQLLVAALLHAAALVCLIHAGRRAVRWWTQGPSPLARWLVLAVAVAAALRLLVVPLRLSMIWVGYRLTAEAIELVPPSHYGVGATTFYHALFAALPPDHITIMAANSVLGVLSIPLLATVCARYLGRPWCGVVFAFCVAVTPLFIRNDNSEANHVPAILWLSGAGVLLLEYAERKKAAALAYSIPLLALAAVSRPEMPALILAVLVALLVGRGGLRTALRDRRVRIAAAVCGLLVVPHMVLVLRATFALSGWGDLPGARAPALALVAALTRSNTLVRPELFPLALSLAAIVGLGASLRRDRGPAVALLVAALCALVAYCLDLDRGNMARVHTPAAYLVTMLASLGIVAVVQRFKLVGGLVCALAVGGALVPSALTHWALTNEEQEERLLRKAVRSLPAGPAIFVRPWQTDAPPERGQVNWHYPDYLLGSRIDAVAITDLVNEPRWDSPVFFLRGFRCFAEHRDPPPVGDNLLPACERMARQFALEPLFEQTAANHGNRWISYFGTSESFLVGLYRVRPRSP